MPTEEVLAPILVVFLMLGLGVFIYSHSDLLAGPSKTSPPPYRAAQQIAPPKI